MAAYYNEWEPETAQWLRELIKDGVVAPGGDGKADKFVDVSTGLWWLRCPDGYARNIEPSIPVLAYGIPKDLVKLCSTGFGNAIVPEVAARFIQATM